MHVAFVSGFLHFHANSGVAAARAQLSLFFWLAGQLPFSVLFFFRETF